MARAEKTYKPVNRPRMERVLPHVWDALDLIDLINGYGDRLLFRYYEGDRLLSMTYAEFGTMIHECAAAFRAMNLTGERIAVIGETSPQWLCAYLAALAEGCVIVPMDREMDTEQIFRFMEWVDIRAVVYGKSFNEKFLRPISGGGTGIRYFIPVTPAYDSTFDGKVVPFRDLVACGRERIEREGYAYPAVESHEVLAEMLFTSGTTGTSKCVMLCQKNIFSTVNAALESVCFMKDDVVVSVLPVHHTYELMCILAEMMYGMQICINDSLRHVLRNFKLFRPTALVLVPLFLNTMYRKIWSEAERTHRDALLRAGLATSKTLMAMGVDARRLIFKSVRDAFGGRLDHIISGGARLNPDLIAAFEDFGISVFEGCGITECAPLISVTPYFNRKYGSVGPAVSSCRIRISEDFCDGRESERGYREGEIQVKGNNVMLGYYDNPEANAAAFTEDRWFRTGDIGYMDDDGFVYITGRMKSVIVLENGKNVFPEEIEEYLAGIETIAECVVLGRQSGEGAPIVLTAVVYPNYQAFPEGASEELIHESIQASVSAVNRKLPGFKQVRSVEIRPTEFEKTTSRKIKRHLVK